MKPILFFGEAMIRLAPPHFARFEQARSLDLEVGGSELNTAVGLARLGHRVKWISRLPDQPLGRIVANQARQAGVDVKSVLWSDGNDRVGLYFLEFGAAPRPSNILYDRANSAMALIQPGMVPWTDLFAHASWFHVTGITPAISASAAAATSEALKLAKEAGITVSFDLNYRAKLWTLEQAGAWLKQHIDYIDVLITTPDDAERFFAISGDTPQARAKQLAEGLHLQAVAFTYRETTSVWKNTFWAALWTQNQWLESAKYEVEIVDRLGAGDAFTSGLIHGLIDEDPSKAIHTATAMAAIQHSIPGDFPWIEKAEIDAMLSGQGLRIRR
jgi:2-dehydro-3-deoxygluconokinase